MTNGIVSKKYVFWGLFGTVAILALYIGILTFANSFPHAMEEFRLLWYWIIPLAIGFGVQIGLYLYMRDLIRKNASSLVVTGSTGISAVSMIACCAHHFVDVLPVLGLSAAAIFLTQYQTDFLALGLISNAASIGYMIGIIKKHGKNESSDTAKETDRASNDNLLSRIGNLLFYAAVIIIFTVIFLSVKNWIATTNNDNAEPAANNANSTDAQTGNLDSLTQTNGNPNQGVEVSATYEKEKSQNQTSFRIAFSTHAINYSDYDFKENIVIIDSRNKEYKAVNFSQEGSGHHQSIEISFPLVSSPFKLAVKNLAGVPERIFNW